MIKKLKFMTKEHNEYKMKNHVMQDDQTYDEKS